MSRLFPPLHCQILNQVAGVVGALNEVLMPNLSGTSLHPLVRLEALAWKHCWRVWGHYTSPQGKRVRLYPNQIPCVDVDAKCVTQCILPCILVGHEGIPLWLLQPPFGGSIDKNRSGSFWHHSKIAAHEILLVFSMDEKTNTESFLNKNRATIVLIPFIGEWFWKPNAISSTYYYYPEEGHNCYAPKFMLPNGH